MKVTIKEAFQIFCEGVRKLDEQDGQAAFQFRKGKILGGNILCDLICVQILRAYFEVATDDDVIEATVLLTHEDRDAVCNMFCGYAEKVIELVAKKLLQRRPESELERGMYCWEQKRWSALIEKWEDNNDGNEGRSRKGAKTE